MAKRITLLLAAFLALAAGSALADDGAAGNGVRGPFAGAVHAVGAIAYRDGGSKSWTWDRGKITALTSSSLTLTRADKKQVTFSLDAGTLVRNDRASYTLADLHTGLVATVISQNGRAAIVRRIRGEGAPSGAEQSAIDGPAKGSVTGSIDVLYRNGDSKSFSYDRGRITAKDAASITIARQDKKQVTFSYDASLLVRDKGEVETADALEVGERAMFFAQNGKLVLVRCLSQPKTK